MAAVEAHERRVADQQALREARVATRVFHHEQLVGFDHVVTQRLLARHGMQHHAGFGAIVLMLGVEQQYRGDRRTRDGLENGSGVTETLAHDLIVVQEPLDNRRVAGLASASKFRAGEGGGEAFVRGKGQCGFRGVPSSTGQRHFPRKLECPSAADV
ncbi:MAG: hypothetical protein PW999_35420 [Paraburkholderia tropica]|nr:hypothetical protein [Paraburkholderia tropica]